MSGETVFSRENCPRGQLVWEGGGGGGGGGGMKLPVVIRRKTFYQSVIF